MTKPKAKTLTWWELPAKDRRQVMRMIDDSIDEWKSGQWVDVEGRSVAYRVHMLKLAKRALRGPARARGRK